MKTIYRIDACAVAQEPEGSRVCGLLGPEEITRSRDEEGIISILREIVERFHIRWEAELRPSAASEGDLASGLVLTLKGTHEPDALHTGRACLHCTNLTLGLRIIGDWILPPEGKCAFCEVQVHSNFVHADECGQREDRSTRTIRLASRLGSRCQVEACHIWCMTKIKERLGKIGAVERENKRPRVEGTCLLPTV